MNKILARRIGMSLCGVIICAIAVGFFKMAAFGVDPFQSLMSGLDQLMTGPADSDSLRNAVCDRQRRTAGFQPGFQPA